MKKIATVAIAICMSFALHSQSLVKQKFQIGDTVTVSQKFLNENCATSQIDEKSKGVIIEAKRGFFSCKYNVQFEVFVTEMSAELLTEVAYTAVVRQKFVKRLTKKS